MINMPTSREARDKSSGGVMDKGQASRRRRSSSGITRVAKRPLSPVGNRTSYTVPGDGTVTSISLINFMNHSKLDINLDPGINIITGRNGSGKSSVLQALVLGLGAPAKATKRGTNVGGFVRHDCPKAEIKVILNNAGEDAFRNSFYGDSITFKRTIYRNGLSNHEVRNARGEVAYSGREATEEKARILGHFNIELDNPTIILQQEEAKCFFKDMKSTTLYDFFERATLLKVMQDEYKAGKAEYDAAKEILAMKHSALEMDKKGRDKLRKKLYHLSSLSKDTLTPEAKWIIVKEKTALVERTKAEVKQLEKKMEVFEAQMESTKIEYEELKKRLEELEMTQSMTTEEVNMAKEKVQYASNNLKDKTDALKCCRNAISLLDNELNDKRTALRLCNNDIRRENSKMEERRKKINNEKAELQKAIHRRENELNGLEGRIERLEKEKEALDDNIRLKQNEERSLHVSVQEKERQKEEIGQELKEMLRKNVTSLDRFGRLVQNLVTDLEKNASCFKRKPIGPIGTHVKMSDSVASNSELADLVEAELGRPFLTSFIVDDNGSDYEELRRLMNVHFHNSKKPYIAICHFTGERYDISNGKAAVGKDIPTVLDFLIIDDPEVFNYVVDIKSVEQIIVVPQAKAQELFEDVKNVPPNVRKAITPDFYGYIPPTKTTFYSSFYMNRLTGQNVLVADAKKNEERLKRSISDSESKLKQMRHKCSEVVKRKQTLTDQKQHVSREIERIRKQVMDNLRADLRQKEVRLQSLLETSDVDSLQKHAGKLKEEIAALAAQIGEEKSKRTDLVREETDAKKEYEEKDKELEILKKRARDTRIIDVRTAADSKLKVMADQQLQRNKVKRQVDNLCNILKNDEAVLGILRENALVATNGKELNPTRTRADIEAMKKEQERNRKAVREDIGMSEEEAWNLLNKANASCLKKQRAIDESRKIVLKQRDSNEQRKALFTHVRRNLTYSVERMFKLLMKEKQFYGDVTIDHNARTLTLTESVDTSQRQSTSNTDTFALQVATLQESETRTELARDLSSFSGGERATTLVCLLRALWFKQMTPFRCLDEWDVYLDERSRASLEEMLYQEAIRSGSQYIFLSPQSTSIKNAKVVVIGDDDTA